jgi:hypothetical protein
MSIGRSPGPFRVLQNGIWPRSADTVDGTDPAKGEEASANVPEVNFGSIGQSLTLVTVFSPV